MGHATVRSILIPEIVKLIMEKYSLSEEETLDKFYTSATGANFSDDETGLYGQSALYVFGMFDEEMRETGELDRAVRLTEKCRFTDNKETARQTFLDGLNSFTDDYMQSGREDQMPTERDKL